MSLQYINAEPSDGGKNGPPMLMAQYVLNANQQLIVLDADFDVTPMEFGSSVMQDGRRAVTKNMGKLNEQNTIFRCQIENSLQIDEWDFEKMPNPEILIVTVE